MLRGEIDIFLSVTAVLYRFLQERAKSLTELGEIDSILWSLGPGYAWLDLAKIQLHIDPLIDFALARHAEHFLGAKTIMECGALLVASARGADFVHNFLIHLYITNSS